RHNKNHLRRIFRQTWSGGSREMGNSSRCPANRARNDPAHPRISNAEAAKTGKQPSYRIGDLGNPNLKPWLVERMKKDNAEVLAGKIAFTARSHCMPAGVPGFMAYPLAGFFLVQTAKQVLMIFSGDQQVRHIYLDVPHSEKVKPSWYGESIGYYEGDTLVVD